MGGRARQKLRCGAPLETRTCPDCQRRVVREQTPSGACPGCGTVVEYRCPQPLTAVHPVCPLHPDVQPDAQPMLERIANTLGAGNAGAGARDSTRTAFLKATGMPAGEMHRLLTAWSMASALEAQSNTNLTAKDRAEFLHSATRAAERFHALELLGQRNTSDWEWRRNAAAAEAAARGVEGSAPGGGAVVSATIVRVNYLGVSAADSPVVMAARDKAERMLTEMAGDDGDDDEDGAA